MFRRLSNKVQSIKERIDEFRDMNCLFQHREFGKLEDEFNADMLGILHTLIDEELSDFHALYRDKMSVYNNHCLGSSKNRLSTEEDIYYDFTSNKEFVKYRNSVAKLFVNPQNDIMYAGDILKVIDGWMSVFTNRGTMLFRPWCMCNCMTCSTSVGIFSDSGEYTKNYTKEGKTINIVLFSKDLEILSMWAVDADWLYNVVDLCLQRYCKKKKKIREAWGVVKNSCDLD